MKAGKQKQSKTIQFLGFLNISTSRSQQNLSICSIWKANRKRNLANERFTRVARNNWECIELLPDVGEDGPGALATPGLELPASHSTITINAMSNYRKMMARIKMDE